MTAFETIAAALTTVTGKTPRRHGRNSRWPCPNHQDAIPSLDVYDAGGRVLMLCRGGCATPDVLTALNLEERDLYDQSSGQELAQYQYTDAQGRPTRTVHRGTGKRFKQTGDLTHVLLYRLPDVVEAVARDEVVWFVEGEADVHALRTLGVVATSTPQGGHGINKVDLSPLQGATVYAIRDKDAAGTKWSQEIIAKLRGYATTLKLFEAREGKDASDHLLYGYELSELVEIEIPDPADGDRRVKFMPASQLGVRKVRWAWKQGGHGRMPNGSLIVIPGREGIGKSLFLAWMAAQLTNGSLPGCFMDEPRPVLYASREDSWEYTINPRLIAAGANRDMVYRVEVEHIELGPMKLSLPRDCMQIARKAKEMGVAALMLDPIVSLIDEKLSVNQSVELRQALEPLAHAAESADMMVLALVHFNKTLDIDIMSKIPGGRAWGEVPRAAFALARNQEAGEGEFVASTVKNNLGMTNLPNLSYTIDSIMVETDEGQTDTGLLRWTGETETGAQEALDYRPKRDSGGGHGGSRDGAGRPPSDTSVMVIEYVLEGTGYLVSEIAAHFHDMSKDGVRKILARAVEKGQIRKWQQAGTSSIFYGPLTPTLGDDPW